MKRRNFNLKAHKEWRQKLLDRDKGCIICQETKKILASHHLLPESKKYEEWNRDVDNGVILCPSHHIWGVDSAHKNPMWFSRWMRIHRNKQYQKVIRILQEFGENVGVEQ